MSIHLHIPGPVHVSEKTLRAMQQPMIGHRSSDFVALYQAIQPGLASLFGTKDPVYVSTSSAWGVMEGSLRNIVGRRVLTCMNGAFSDKWFDVAQRCGKEATALKFEWGKPVDPAAVREQLATGAFDAITLVHNETSTGTMSPLAGIMSVVREFPDVISIVDTVSSFSALPIPKDELGIDIMLTGSQKALALPPGMSLFAVSERARARASNMPGRGYYFDLIEFQANHEKGMTPSTPTIALIYALQSKLEDIAAEGIENRHARHAHLNARVRAWGEAKGLTLFPEPQYGSITLNCLRNTLGFDPSALNKLLKSKHGFLIDGGYGKLKGKTIRISNMGDETDASMEKLLAAIDASLAELSAPGAAA
jgi:aspartate aminotransferase-like enzyme